MAKIFFFVLLTIFHHVWSEEISIDMRETLSAVGVGKDSWGPLPGGCSVGTPCGSGNDACSACSGTSAPKPCGACEKAYIQTNSGNGNTKYFFSCGLGFVPQPQPPGHNNCANGIACQSHYSSAAGEPGQDCTIVYCPNQGESCPS